MSSAELPTVELEIQELDDSLVESHDLSDISPRSEDVAIKQQRIAEFLEDEGYDAVLLSRQEDFAWFTAGGDNGPGTSAPIEQASLFITRDQRCVLATNVESGRIFDEEVAGLGFQLKECRWDEPRDRLLDDICRGRKVASDTGVCGTVNELDKLRRLRINLTELERQRYRELGRAVAHAIEATCRNARPGETEHEVAGELSHRLIRHGISPVTMYIGGDDRAGQFRLPTHKAQPIQHRLTISASGRRHGLCASATRTISFGATEKELVDRHHISCMVDATYIFFSRPGEQGSEVMRRGRRILEKTGTPHEWLLAPQGAVTGYSPSEVLLVPSSPFRFRAGMAVNWTPSIGSARSGDTVLLYENGFEILTPTHQWPYVTISVKGFEVERPAILILDI